MKGSIESSPSLPPPDTGPPPDTSKESIQTPSVYKSHFIDEPGEGQALDSRSRQVGKMWDHLGEKQQDNLFDATENLNLSADQKSIITDIREANKNNQPKPVQTLAEAAYQQAIRPDDARSQEQGKRTLIALRDVGKQLITDHAPQGGKEEWDSLSKNGKATVRYAEMMNLTAQAYLTHYSSKYDFPAFKQQGPAYYRLFNRYEQNTDVPQSFKDEVLKPAIIHLEKNLPELIARTVKPSPPPAPPESKDLPPIKPDAEDIPAGLELNKPPETNIPTSPTPVDFTLEDMSNTKPEQQKTPTKAWRIGIEKETEFTQGEIAMRRGWLKEQLTAPGVDEHVAESVRNNIDKLGEYISPQRIEKGLQLLDNLETSQKSIFSFIQKATGEKDLKAARAIGSALLQPYLGLEGKRRPWRTLNDNEKSFARLGEMINMAADRKKVELILNGTLPAGNEEKLKNFDKRIASHLRSDDIPDDFKRTLRATSVKLLEKYPALIKPLEKETPPVIEKKPEQTPAQKSPEPLRSPNTTVEQKKQEDEPAPPPPETEQKKQESEDDIITKLVKAFERLIEDMLGREKPGRETARAVRPEAPEDIGRYLNTMNEQERAEYFAQRQDMNPLFKKLTQEEVYNGQKMAHGIVNGDRMSEYYAEKVKKTVDRSSLGRGNKKTYNFINSLPLQLKYNEHNRFNKWWSRVNVLGFWGSFGRKSEEKMQGVRDAVADSLRSSALNESAEAYTLRGLNNSDRLVFFEMANAIDNVNLKDIEKR